ncbi:hypothetical protein ACMD2_14539 [Ananas comosus]|uniref:Uncharacterized protein n=1 Tax=Ananas comosus TaxID=4615 RepID=A0A199W181_ANACO|nr:hypothetical protein ACMD2_14539 [Ananas comosus]
MAETKLRNSPNHLRVGGRSRLRGRPPVPISPEKDLPIQQWLNVVKRMLITKKHEVTARVEENSVGFHIISVEFGLVLKQGITLKRYHGYVEGLDHEFCGAGRGSRTDFSMRTVGQRLCLQVAGQILPGPAQRGFTPSPSSAAAAANSSYLLHQPRPLTAAIAIAIAIGAAATEVPDPPRTHKPGHRHETQEPRHRPPHPRVPHHPTSRSLPIGPAQQQALQRAPASSFSSSSSSSEEEEQGSDRSRSPFGSVGRRRVGPEAAIGLSVEAEAAAPVVVVAATVCWAEATVAMGRGNWAWRGGLELVGLVTCARE